MGLKFKIRHSEVNSINDSIHQQKFDCNRASGLTCKGGCYIIQSLHTLYSALLCTASAQLHATDAAMYMALLI